MPEIRTGTEVEFIASLSACLHEMSQPMTVLLCALEYGGRMQSAAEMKEVLALAQEASERLGKTVVAMQQQMRSAMEAIVVAD